MLSSKMEPCIPTVEEHCQLLILVQQCGSKSRRNFNCLVDRLRKISSIIVSENPRRFVQPRFITCVNQDLVSWGEFQVHRRILGLVGVAWTTAESTNQDERRASTSWNGLIGVEVEIITSHYNCLKSQFKSSLIDCRCLLFDGKKASSQKMAEHLPEMAEIGHKSLDNPDKSIPSLELLTFATLDIADNLENDIRELIKSIFWVLESRRLDLSFEKIDNPPCPFVAEEEKYRVGVENKNSKNYRRKCLGRLKKLIADYALITGAISVALEMYSNAIELLKNANDFLWLAGAYEGWSCTLVMTKYENCLEWKSSMHRVSTFNGKLIKVLETPVFGHVRHRSDEKCTEILHGNQRISISYLEIVDKFRLAIDNYEKYSFASIVQYETVMKTVNIFQRERRYVEMEQFLREHVGKYLDDNFNIFDHMQKSQICTNSAGLFKAVGFMRKAAFFTRLAVLFRLNVNSKDEEMREMDYKVIYHILYRTLSGYGIPENCKDIHFGGRKGPVDVQIRALHEVYISALRAGYKEAAIRHLCFLLQAYLDDMEGSFLANLVNELVKLCSQTDHLHPANQHISLPMGIILPPLPMNRLPIFRTFEILPLIERLAPIVVTSKNDDNENVFIYTPFRHQNQKTLPVKWVVDCLCTVFVEVKNPLPFKLRISNLALSTEESDFEAIPVQLDLPPNDAPSTFIELMGYPRKSGTLLMTGYLCEVFSVKNVCKLRDIPDLICDTMQRAPILNDELEAIAEITIYEGEIVEHSIRIANSSKISTIFDVDLILEKQDENLITLKNWETLEKTLEPNKEHEIQFQIFGIEINTFRKEKNKYFEKIPNEFETDKLPETELILTSEFVFCYKSQINDEIYKRIARLPLTIKILPRLS